MHRIEVGKPLRPGLVSLPEGAQYNLHAGGHELDLWLPQPTTAEVKAVRQGPAEFGLIEVPEAPDVLWLLYRFEGPGGRGFPWSDAPYSWHMVPEGRRVLPEVLTREPERAFLQVILADSATAIVKGMRALSLAPEFSAALHDAILQQSTRPWPGRSYDRQIAATSRRYPSTEALLEQAEHRSIGGA